MDSESVLPKLTEQNNKALVNTGNAAIFIALFHSQQLGFNRVIIPKDGGWFSYKYYPKLLGMEVVKAPTDWAKLNPEQLNKLAKAGSVLLYSVISGYFVLNNTKQIAEVMHKSKCLVIADVSASIGLIKLDKQEADFEVCSFGDNKPLAVGYGGFIATKFELNKNLLKAFKFPEMLKEKLIATVGNLKNSWQNMLETRAELIDKLAKYCEIAHKGSLGVNIVVKGWDAQAVTFCKQQSLPYLKCPRYHRVNKKAISIELKTLFSTNPESFK